MGLMDRVKAQATQVAQKAQEAGKAGQAKLDQVQAKRKADSLLRDLGAAVYAQRTGSGGPDAAAKVDQLVTELRNYEAEHGSVLDDDSGEGGDAGTTAPGPSAGTTGTTPSDVPEGGFTLD